MKYSGIENVMNEQSLCVLLLLVAGATAPRSAEGILKCGQVLKAKHGVISTPGFPQPFTVPISCRWVIDASHHHNMTIVVYLTQVYVTAGITFMGCSYYDDDDKMYGCTEPERIIAENVTTVPWLRSDPKTPYFIIDFQLNDRLEGYHLRLLNDVHAVHYVFGFNVTYELLGVQESVKSSCNVGICSALGECVVSADFNSFECLCFSGFSGPYCSDGPFCRGQPCLNGGTCRHLSAVSYGCTCPRGFVSSKCEVALPKGCEGGICSPQQCPAEDTMTFTCSCPHPLPVPKDRTHYEISFRVINANSNLYWNSVRSIDVAIEKTLLKYLRSERVNMVESLKVLNFTSLSGEVTFHFFGNKSEQTKVKDAVEKMVDKGRLGNFTILTTQRSMKVDPHLNLTELKASKRSVTVGEEFSLSCIAVGSVFMSFAWYKDGIYINKTIAQRSISYHFVHLPQDTYQYTMVLGKASLFDQGRYTCRVIDWGVEQCASIYVEIAGIPEISLTPRTKTVDKGENLDITCIPEDNFPQQERLGYSWLKNGDLLPFTVGQEVWEDLYLSQYRGVVNTGSVLEITNIQKSATFSCVVTGVRGMSKPSTRVHVIPRGSHICEAVSGDGVSWPRTAPNMEAIVDCPRQTSGVAVRQCLQTTKKTPQWQLPDFSGCSYHDVLEVMNNFGRLALGYQVTNCQETIFNLHKVIKAREFFRSGDSGSIFKALKSIQQYMIQFNSYSLASLRPFYEIIDFILSHDHTILFDSQLLLLQTLIKRQALQWSFHLTVQLSEGLNLTNFVLEAVSLNSTMFNSLSFPPALAPIPWMTDRVDVQIDPSKLNAPANSTVTVVIAAYKNLTRYLPPRYLLKLSDGTDVIYELISRIVTVEVSYRNSSLRPHGDGLSITLEFETVHKEVDLKQWRMACAVTDTVSLTNNWDLKSCVPRSIPVTNKTRCLCSRPGTFALVITSQPLFAEDPHKPAIHVPVLVGCISCLFFSVATLAFLVPHWWSHRTCLLFLKIQCCFTIAGAMGVFVYAVHSNVPKPFLPVVMMFLEVLLLLPLTSHISNILLIFTELAQLPRSSHINKTIIWVMSGAPFLAMLANLLGHHTTGMHPVSWWLLRGTMEFNVFVITGLVICLLFVFLHASLLRKLRVLSQRNNDENRGLTKRLGLLKRSGSIFVVLALTEAASIIYVNVKDTPSQYLFGSLSALLGLVLLLCYAVKSESPPHQRLLKKLKMEPTTPDDISSDSGISPLSFFTKQDGEVESEGAAPRLRGRDRDVRGDAELAEQLLLTESRRSETSRTVQESSNTLETFVYSDPSLMENPVLPVSPSRYKPMTSFKLHCKAANGSTSFGEYVEHEVDEPVLKPIPVQSYIRDLSATQHTEMITTRVCVELGVITTHQRNEETGMEVDAPAIVLCSVDVEPSQSRMVEVPDALCYSGVGAASSFVLGIAGQETEGLVCGDSPPEVEITTESKVSPVPAAPPETNGLSPAEECNGLAQSKQQDEIVETTNNNNIDNMEGMLDRISHDLDYLLNRKASPMPNNLKRAVNCKVTILEEVDDEEEDECSGPAEYLAKC